MTLAYIFDHAVCCASAANAGRNLHLIISQLRTKYSSSNCPNPVQQNKSSIKKRIIVHQTVQTIFTNKHFAQLKTSITTLYNFTSGLVLSHFLPLFLPNLYQLQVSLSIVQLSLSHVSCTSSKVWLCEWIMQKQTYKQQLPPPHTHNRKSVLRIKAEDLKL